MKTFEEALAELQANITNPSLVNEMLDGPCSVHAVNKPYVIIKDGEKLAELRFDHHEGIFELML
jgi:hypothetical protein